MGRVVRNGKGPSARDYAISVGGENVLMFCLFLVVGLICVLFLCCLCFGVICGCCNGDRFLRLQKLSHSGVGACMQWSVLMRTTLRMDLTLPFKKSASQLWIASLTGTQLVNLTEFSNRNIHPPPPSLPLSKTPTCKQQPASRPQEEREIARYRRVQFSS